MSYRDAEYVIDFFMNRYEFRITGKRLSSAMNFFTKLDAVDVFDAVDVLEEKDIDDPFSAWKYFCGICWNKVQQREDEALF